MKLNEIKLPAKVYCECSDGSNYITVDHLDGMYSYCKTEKGAVVHLSRFSELEKFKDSYKLRV
jgi:hypothetical protein